MTWNVAITRFRRFWREYLHQYLIAFLMIHKFTFSHALSCTNCNIIITVQNIFWTVLMLCHNYLRYNLLQTLCRYIFRYGPQYAMCGYYLLFVCPYFVIMWNYFILDCLVLLLVTIKSAKSKRISVVYQKLAKT